MSIWKKGDTKPANWPQWLKDADIDWCKVDIIDGAVIWRKGKWRHGVWHGGRWDSGEWCGGTWIWGVWHDGVWGGGEWLGGRWDSGEWIGGVWHDGMWYGGKWFGGGWRGGGWRGGDNIARSVNQALVGWSGHGECGRVLRAWDCPERMKTMYSCGCFYGSREELIDFIHSDEERHHIKSRLRALAHVDELLEDGRNSP